MSPTTCTTPSQQATLLAEQWNLEGAIRPLQGPVTHVEGLLLARIHLQNEHAESAEAVLRSLELTPDVQALLAATDIRQGRAGTPLDDALFGSLSLAALSRSTVSVPAAPGLEAS